MQKKKKYLSGENTLKRRLIKSRPEKSPSHFWDETVNCIIKECSKLSQSLDDEFSLEINIMSQVLLFSSYGQLLEVYECIVSMVALDMARTGKKLDKHQTYSNYA